MFSYIDSFENNDLQRNESKGVSKRVLIELTLLIKLRYDAYCVYNEFIKFVLSGKCFMRLKCSVLIIGILVFFSKLKIK